MSVRLEEQSRTSRWKQEIFSAAPSGQSWNLLGTKKKRITCSFFLSLHSSLFHPPPPPQTKDALLSILNDLRPADRFNLVGFSSKVKVWQPGRLLPVTPLNIRDAKKFIFTLPTTGGQMSPVHLYTCLSIRLSTFVFVCPSVCLSTFLSGCPSIHLFSCLSVCPSIHLPVLLCT